MRALPVCQIDQLHIELALGRLLLLPLVVVGLGPVGLPGLEAILKAGHRRVCSHEAEQKGDWL